MSVGTYGFAVDLDRLRAVFGSHDDDLASAVETRYIADIEEIENYVSEGDPWLREALRDIVAGEVRHPERVAFYVWATEFLCACVGEKLELCDEIGWLDELKLGALGLEKSGPPLPIPRHDDSPMLGFLTAEQVVEQYERLKSMDLSHDDEYIEAGRRMMLSWHKSAADRGMALVTLTQG